MKILVIEDETKVAAALKKGLECEFFRVVLARTGEESFFQMNSEVFDLILLDLMLSGRDGFEVLQPKHLVAPAAAQQQSDTLP
jgi:two-component system copper resistance phosphate regulon response regulator CusR